MKFTKFVDAMFADDSLDQTSKAAIYTLAPILEGHDVPPPPASDNSLDGWQEWARTLTGTALFTFDERELIHNTLTALLTGDYATEVGDDRPESSDYLVRLQEVAGRHRDDGGQLLDDQKLDDAKCSARKAIVDLEAMVDQLDDPSRATVRRVQRLAGSAIDAINSAEATANDWRDAIEG